jgi:hypothetical protein
VQEPEIRIPTIEELRAVLGTASDVRAFADVRDAAVIRLWLDTGLRRSVLAGLTVADVNVTDGEVSVMGKGRKPRRVAYGNATAKALGRWLTWAGRRTGRAGAFATGVQVAGLESGQRSGGCRVGVGSVGQPPAGAGRGEVAQLCLDGGERLEDPRTCRVAAERADEPVAGQPRLAAGEVGPGRGGARTCR